MSRNYAIKDRDGTVRDEPGLKEAQRSRRAYGGMLVQRKGEGDWKPWKRRRVFLWVFLAIQAIFIIWLISAAAQGTGASHADIASTCGNRQWYPLWKSYSDCAAHSGVVAAHDIGKGIAVGLIVLIWVVVDFVVALTYGIYRLAARRG